MPRESNAPLRILIVDDSPEDRFTYRRLLSRGGGGGVMFDLSEAASGIAAIDRLTAEEFDCVLLDYRLMDRSGIEVLEEVLGDGATPSVAFVMLTGQGDEHVAVEAMKSGVQDYLVKGSVSRESLERAIHSAIERVDLRRELDRHRLDLMRSNRELERFASVVAHDLQSPLATMQMMLQIVQDDDAAGGPDGRRKFVRGALAASARMSQLIEDLLNYSRLGGPERSTVEMSSADLLAEALDSLRALIEASGASVTSHDLPIVHGDRTQVRQVFQNLVANGIRYHGAAAPRIEVTCEATRDTWTFRVSDNGIGIDPSRQEDVFGPLFRLHRHDDIPGSGLGLAICKKVIEGHGGSIGMDSKVGEGTVVWFTIPQVTPTPS